MLVVESDPADGADLHSKLANLGFVVAGPASDLGEALRLAAETEPRIALIDVRLRQASTASDGRWNAFLRGRFPVLLTVRDDDHEHLRLVRTTHPGRYLLKPFSEREVRSGIADCLALDGRPPAPMQFDDDFFEIAIDMLCCLGFDGYFTRLNPSWERVLGFDRQELMSRPFIEFVHPDDRERTLQQNRAVRGGGSARLFENRYLCKDGSYRWLMWNAAPDPTRSSIYAVARDVTDLKLAEEALERLSITDELTGVWNRRGFSILAEKELARAARRTHPLLLFYMDMDGLKDLNDTFGHAAGDRVLFDVARLLQESCRGSDVVARIGGDEFVLLAADEHGEGERVITDRIRKAVLRLNESRRHAREIGLTIGALSVTPGEGADLATLLARADSRMYVEKRKKRDGEDGAGRPNA